MPPAENSGRVVDRGAPGPFVPTAPVFGACDHGRQIAGIRARDALDGAIAEGWAQFT